MILSAFFHTVEILRFYKDINVHLIIVKYLIDWIAMSTRLLKFNDLYSTRKICWNWVEVNVFQTFSAHLRANFTSFPLVSSARNTHTHTLWGYGKCLHCETQRASSNSHNALTCQTFTALLSQSALCGNNLTLSVFHITCHI